MRTGVRNNVGQRGGAAYKGHGKKSNIDDKLEPVNRETENYCNPMDEPQDTWDPDIEYNEWDIENDDEDKIN
jgi:hypothetical protein